MWLSNVLTLRLIIRKIYKKIVVKFGHKSWKMRKFSRILGRHVAPCRWKFISKPWRIHLHKRQFNQDRHMETKFVKVRHQTRSFRFNEMISSKTFISIAGAIKNWLDRNKRIEHKRNKCTLRYCILNEFFLLIFLRSCAILFDVALLSVDFSSPLLIPSNSFVLNVYSMKYIDKEK